MRLPLLVSAFTVIAAIVSISSGPLIGATCGGSGYTTCEEAYPTSQFVEPRSATISIESNGIYGASSDLGAGAARFPGLSAKRAFATGAAATILLGPVVTTGAPLLTLAGGLFAAGAVVLDVFNRAQMLLDRGPEGLDQALKGYAIVFDRTGKPLVDTTLGEHYAVRSFLSRKGFSSTVFAAANAILPGRAGNIGGGLTGTIRPGSVGAFVEVGVGEAASRGLEGIEADIAMPSSLRTVAKPAIVCGPGGVNCRIGVTLHTSIPTMRDLDLKREVEQSILKALRTYRRRVVVVQTVPYEVVITPQAAVAAEVKPLPPSVVPSLPSGWSPGSGYVPQSSSSSPTFSMPRSNIPTSITVTSPIGSISVSL